MLKQPFQSFDVNINIFCCILKYSTRGCFHKTQALFLQIQGVFQEKIIFQGPSSFSGSIPGPCKPCMRAESIKDERMSRLTFYLKGPQSNNNDSDNKNATNLHIW